MSWLLTLVLVASPEPNRQTKVFYNARLAQRARQPNDVLKLWLVRNSLVDQGQPGTHDDAFHSLVWAATGSLGLCQDGLPRDHAPGGAGLWPIALHNALLVKGDPDELPSPYEAYDVGRQQRLVSLSDVLDDEELESVTFSRTACFMPGIALFEAGGNPFADLDDRLVWGELLRWLLRKSLSTVNRAQVTSTAVIEARLFDLDLTLTELRERRKRERAAERAGEVRGANMSSGAASSAGRLEAQKVDTPAQLAFLRRTLRWAPAEWLSLSKGRREFLFANAARVSLDQQAPQSMALGIIDLLIDQNAGAEVSGWVAQLEGEAARAQVTEGRRGERLLALGDDSGFRERSVIALHRGVAHLQQGALAEALQSFAFALKHSSESAAGSTVHPLARRWLSFVLSRYEASAQVLATLKALVPRPDFNPVVEDLIWAAGLRGDATSFDRLAASVQRGTAFDDRVARLGLLAHRKPTELVAQLRATAVESPFDTLRFCRQLLDALEREQADVRFANRALVAQVLAMLEGIASEPGAAKTNERLARELAGRAQSILEALGINAGPMAESRALSLDHSTFAGALRLAPADPLPWPFERPAVEAPQSFAPLRLTPIEWRDDADALVFGWKVTE